MFCPLLFFLTLPASIGLAVLGETVLDSIYFGGRWDHLATVTALYPLVFYSLAIPFYSINKVLVSSYYAFSDTKTPLRIQLISFSLSVLVSIGLMYFLKHSAIALASALSASVTSSLLLFYLKSHQVKIPFLTVWLRILKMVPALFGLFLWLVVSELGLKPVLLVSLMDNLGMGYANGSRICLVVSILPAIVIYFALASFTKLPESEIILGRFLRKFRRK